MRGWSLRDFIVLALLPKLNRGNLLALSERGHHVNRAEDKTNILQPLIRLWEVCLPLWRTPTAALDQKELLNFFPISLLGINVPLLLLVELLHPCDISTSAYLFSAALGAGLTFNLTNQMKCLRRDPSPCSALVLQAATKFLLGWFCLVWLPSVCWQPHSACAEEGKKTARLLFPVPPKHYWRACFVLCSFCTPYLLFNCCCCSIALPGRTDEMASSEFVRFPSH